MQDTIDTGEVESYRAVSVWAVVALGLAGLSPLAMLSTLLWPLPLAAMGVAAAALWRTRTAAVAGAKLAWAAMALGVLTLSAAVADTAVYRHLVRRDARVIAEEWFALLAGDQPQSAYLLTLPCQYRPAADEDPLSFYQRNTRWRSELDAYTKLPLQRALLALGQNADVRFYEAGDYSRSEGIEVLELIYAVSSAERPETFLVTIWTERSVRRSGEVCWRVVRAEGDVRPEGL